MQATKLTRPTIFDVRLDEIPKIRREVDASRSMTAVRGLNGAEPASMGLKFEKSTIQPISPSAATKTTVALTKHESHLQPITIRFFARSTIAYLPKQPSYVASQNPFHFVT